MLDWCFYYCSCSCHDCGSGYSCDSDPLQFTICLISTAAGVRRYSADSYKCLCAEFNRDVNTKVNEHTGYDFGELVYVDYEGMEENPSNYYDIMAVYMVKYGVGDTATVMNDTSRVVADCSK